MKTNTLTQKQQAFVDAILRGAAPNQAAREAGYKYAPQAALTLSKQTAVMDAIAAGRKEENKKMGRHEDTVIITAASTQGSGKGTDAPRKQEPKQEPKDTTPDTDALRKALRDIIGNTVDEARVRKIVEEVVAEQSGMQPIRVEIVQPAMKKVTRVGIQHRAFPLLMTKLLAGRNVYLAGPAGTGKTTAARNAAAALSKALGREIPFYFNGAIDSEHKLLGFTDAQGNVVSRPFRKAFTEGGVYLFDEVDASLPGALLAFNAALSNGTCDFPDGCFEQHPDFRCIAAANTWGHGATHDYVGRAKLDEAFRDRFAMLEWGNDESLERALALREINDKDLGGRWITHVQQCRANAARAGIRCVISPRASISGCALLHHGEEWAETERSVIRKGMPDESWKQVVGASA